MSNNQLALREQEARQLVAQKAKQISTLVGENKAKASKLMSTLVQLSQNRNLIDCKVDSILDVGFQIVQSGLNPNPLFGQAFVVPFKINNKKTNTGLTVAQLQVGYKGYIQMSYRAGWSVKAVSVYKCDEFNYEFGGFEDKIHFIPNYEARNEDDGNWVFDNLVGEIVYTKDKNGNIYTEFVSKKKLDKLRLKSPNQVKDKLLYIWLEWAEEMYKAKAVKYVLSRLPIGDELSEIFAKEDEVYAFEGPKLDTKKPNINNLAKQPNDEIIDTEIENSNANDTEIEKNPKAMIMAELQKRGLTEEEAGKWCWNKSDDEFLAYLNDPASIEAIVEQMVGF